MKIFKAYGIGDQNISKWKFLIIDWETKNVLSSDSIRKGSQEDGISEDGDQRNYQLECIFILLKQKMSVVKFLNIKASESFTLNLIFLYFY